MNTSTSLCEETVTNIQKGGKYREAAVKKIYEFYFEKVIRLFKNKYGYGLTADETMMAYNDAIMALIRAITLGRFSIQGKEACFGYIYQVGNWKCIDMLRAKPDVHFEEDDSDYIKNNIAASQGNPEEQWIRNEYMEALQKLNEKCKNILIDWISGYSMEEIANRNDLKNANSAAVTRRTCFRKLKDILRNLGL